MSLSTHILVLIIGIIYPVYFVLTYKRTNLRLKNEGGYRLVDYKLTIFIFWLLTLLVLANSIFEETPLLHFFPTLNTVGIVLSVLILIFIILQVATSKISTIEKADSTIEKVKENFHYLPKSRREFIWFNILSVSAGVCEEIIFRLFIFSYLSEHTHLILAFVLTNASFALTHIGSGKQNIVGAFILGVVFTAIYYFSSNIWLAIALHIAIDIGIGVLGYSAYRFIQQYTPEIHE